MQRGMIDKELVFKEIDLIQSCIVRMNNNSFMIKGWALAILTGVTAITKGENLKDIILLLFSTVLPFLSFWMLDAYYLHTERRYRLLYLKRLHKRKNNDDTELFELDLRNIKGGSVLKAMFSNTLRLFYGIPFVTGLIYMFYLFYKSFVV